MKKRILAFLILASMQLTLSAQAKTVEFILDEAVINTSENFVTENGTLLAAPFIQNDRTMIPVRALSEQFGAEVGWDAPSRTVTVKKEGADISLVIDNTTAYVNGEAVALDAAPVIRGDITFVPVRFVTENMGFYVNFIPKTRSILVTDAKPAAVNGVPVYDYEINGIYYIFATLQGIDYAAAMAYNTALQNTVFAEEAKKEQLALTPEDDALIDQLLEAETTSALLGGELALIYEKDLLSSLYLEHTTALHKDSPEVQAYYEENYLCAKHVLVGGTDDAAKEKAEEIAKKAKNGEDFDALVTAYGEDPGMQANPNGYVFTSGEMVSSFEEGTKALKPGSISEPILSEYGYHIIMRQPLPALTDETATAIVRQLYLMPLMQSAVIE